MRRINFIGMLAAAFILASFSVLAVGAMAKDVYPAKEIEFICHAAPGGGYDIHARMITPYLAKFIKEVSPGAKGKDVKIKNMPGAAAAKAYTYLYNEAERDGYTIGDFNTGDIAKFTLGSQKLPFDLLNFTWLFAIQGAPRVVISSKKGLATWEEMLAKSKKEGLIFSTGSAGGAANMDVIFFIEGVGLQAKIAPTGGTAQSVSAILRGDSDAALQNYDAVKTLIDSKEVNVIVTITEERIVPQAPTIKEKGFGNLLGVIGDPVGRICMGPPNLDPEAKRILLAAASKLTADPEFLALYKKMMYSDLYYFFDKELEQRVKGYQKAMQERSPILKKYGLIKD